MFVGTILASIFAVYVTLGPFFGLWQSPELPINTDYMATMVSLLISSGIIVTGSLLLPESYDFDYMTTVTSSARETRDD